jgi:IS4 transposase
MAKAKARKAARRAKQSYRLMEGQVLGLLSRPRVEAIARETGFTQRVAKQIPPFEFALCCALAAVTEAKRGFACVWRLLSAAAGIEVARSAVTQRYGPGSAEMMKQLFLEAQEKLPSVAHPELLGKLESFTAVLADDGSVLRLSPLLAKLFPACRTNHTKAAAKLHAQVDLVHRRLIRVEVTGERESEREVARAEPFHPDVLYIRDLGYTSYDDYAEAQAAESHLLMRLKDDANPTVVRVRHGVVAPRQSEGQKLNALRFTSSHDTFDVDAQFQTQRHGCITLRVVGCFNPETHKYHCYVTTLSPNLFSVEELTLLYRLRWVVELFFKFLKSYCHLDHLDTSNPDALRTHLYASLLAATLMCAVSVAAAKSAGFHPSEISLLTLGVATPLLAIPLLLLWLQRPLTPQELADLILRTVAVGCRNQNPKRTQKKWAPLN